MKSTIPAFMLTLLLAGPALAQAPATPPAGGDSPKDSATTQPRPADPGRPATATTTQQPGATATPAKAAPRPTESPRSAAPAARPAADQAPPKEATQPKAKHDKTSKALKKLLRFVSWFHPSTVWYLQYRYGRTLANDGGEDSTFNRFFVGRGYLTLKFKPTKWFESRITMDTHQDGEGSWGVRLKYLYAKFKLPMETAIVTEPFVEFGMAHIPWLDYEEHINYYRAQGTMFVERNKLHNSADLGITVGTLFGRKLSKKYRETVNSKYPGTWGSAAIGVYNGAGYHGLELNNWKNVEGRISLRPGGHWFPNLQVSYFFVWGKGANRPEPVNVGDPEFDWPTWQQNLFMVSFEHQYLTATAQYVFGRGNQKGSEDLSGWLRADGESRRYHGASGFLEVKLPWIKSSVWGRYDYWNGPYGDLTKPYHRFMAAYAFHFWGFHQNFLMLDFEYLKFDDGNIPEARQDQWALTLSVQVHLH